MKICVAIPTYNHTERLGGIVASLPRGVCAVVVDDGSNPPVKVGGENVRLLRFEKNRGKAEALKAAFGFAEKLGFTHVVTMDADGQHAPSSLPDFISAAEKSPDKIIVGVRDFDAPDIPPKRRFLNKFSNFWFERETGERLGDTQCGFRCYPLAQIERLALDFGGFVFEVELLVKAAWAGIGFEQIPIPTIYDESTIGGSHYKPFSDTLKFTLMNTKLYFQSLLLPRGWLKKIALKK